METVIKKSDPGKFTVLLVDDNAGIRLTVGDFLRAKGLNVIRASGGAEALEIIHKTIPDIVVLDIMMPDVDGGDVAQAIRRRRETAKVPIIFLTAAVRADEASRGDGQIGGDVYVSKTSPPSELLARIHECLGNG